MARRGSAATEPSDKSYTTAVILSAVFGLLGVQHFYLRRYGEGLLDVGLTGAWIYAFAVDEPLAALGFFGLDFIHTVVVTTLLLTGSFKDGSGRRVCYPGQKLPHHVAPALGPERRGEHDEQ